MSRRASGPSARTGIPALARAALLAAFALPLMFSGCTPEPRRTPPAKDYPAGWNVEVPGASRLAAVKARFDEAAARLPPHDLEDRSPLPPWFRAYLRASFPGLPTAGPYQYPHYAHDILRWMLQHPDLSRPEQAEQRRLVTNQMPPPIDNVSLTANLAEINNESAIARNPANPVYVIAAANSRDKVGASSWQAQFYSADSGATWGKTQLPRTGNRDFHGDPSVAYSSDGSSAFATTLGFHTDDAGATVWVQFYRSTNQGRTWSHRSDVSNAPQAANDKPMMWVDTHPGSPFRDRIYLAWNVLNGDSSLDTRVSTGIHFAYSADGGLSWVHAKKPLTTANATGVHLATGPQGELYVGWAETDARAIRVVKSKNGGNTFAAPRLIAQTHGAYRNPIPAACKRWPMTYVLLGVDRTDTAAAPVYAAWTDHDGSPEGAPCDLWNTRSRSTKVYFSSSLDGGDSWSTARLPVAAPALPGAGDQFNPWMAVDPSDRSIHLAMYDTRADPNRHKTHLYYVRSQDRGNSWSAPRRVTDLPTDETDNGATADQYGDYNGLSALNRLAIATWTDRRDPGTPPANNGEQIYAAGVSNLPLPGCLLTPELCQSPVSMSPGKVVLRCPRRPCRVVDPLPQNCLVKFTCPICARSEQCPRRYRLKLDGTGGWDVGLVGPSGTPVPHQQSRTRTGIDLTFEIPEGAPLSLHDSGYALTFDLGDAGQIGADYPVRMILEPLGK